MMRLVKVFTAGAAAGVLLGIWFAPDKGSVTRKKMNDAGKKMAEGLDQFRNPNPENIIPAHQEM